MTIPDHLRLPFTFDPRLLRRDLERLSSSYWTQHFVRQNYEGDWSAIALRCAAGATHPVMQIYSDPTTTVFEDAPALALCPYFREVLARFSCPIQSVRLMRLTPGSRIKEHRDYDLDVEAGTIRIHVPVTTNPGVEFVLNGSPVILEPGSAWYLRLSDPHCAANNGVTDRVHLVLDAIVDDGMRDVLQHAASAFA